MINLNYKFVRRPGHFRSGGSSLIEVLIAFVVLALGITSIVSFQGRLTHESNHAKSRTEAANVGNIKLEEFRNYPDLSTFDAITNGSDTVGPTGSGATYEFANLSHTYTRQWSVTTSTNAKTVAMQITWPDKDGSVSNNTTVKLDTIMARLDPASTVLSIPTTTATTSSTTTTSTTSTTSTTTTTTTTTTSTTTTTTNTSSSSTSSTSSSSSSSTTSSSTTTTTTTTTVAATYTITISGSFNITASGGHVQDVEINGTDCGYYSDTGYSCTIGPLPVGDTWSGTISVDSNKHVCGGSSTGYSGISSDQSTNYTIANNSGSCP